MDFKKVVFGAFYIVNGYRASLAKALAIPFCFYLAIEGCAYLELPDVISWLLAVLSWIVYAVIAITTHRVVLLGPNSVPKWGITSWSKRETYFIFHVLAIGLITMGVSLLGLIPVVGLIAALLASCWLLPRFSLVFPGIAVDKGVTLKLSWELTKNYQLHMFLIVILFPILLSIPTLLFALVPYGSFLSSVCAAFVIVVEIAALSLTYQQITSEVYAQG